MWRPGQISRNNIYYLISILRYLDVLTRRTFIRKFELVKTDIDTNDENININMRPLVSTVTTTLIKTETKALQTVRDIQDIQRQVLTLLAVLFIIISLWNSVVTPLTNTLFLQIILYFCIKLNVKSRFY